MSNLETLTRLKILSITDNENGTSTLNFELDDDFIEWFKKKEGLKRFSHKRFSKFIKEAIANHINSNNENFTGVVGTIVSEENK